MAASVSNSPQRDQTHEIDFSPLFFTIYGQLEESPNSTANEIAYLLSTNHDLLLAFQQSPYTKIREQFYQLISDQCLPQATKVKIHNITKQLYEAALRNSSTAQVLVQRNAELDSLTLFLQRDIQKEAHDLQREIRLVLRNIKAQNLTNMPMDQIQVHVRQLQKLTHAMQPILDLKKCIFDEENVRIRDLAFAYQHQGAETQFPRILQEYPRIVAKIERLESTFKSISLLMKETQNTLIRLKSRIHQMANRDDLSLIEKHLLIPFGNVLYPAAAECFWQIVIKSESQRSDLLLTSLFESGKLASPLPLQVDHLMIYNLWELYFYEPGLSEIDFESWIKIIFSTMDSDTLQQSSDLLDSLNKKIDETNENQDIPLSQRQNAIAALQHEMLITAKELLNRCLSDQMATLADIKEALFAYTLK